MVYAKVKRIARIRAMSLEEWVNESRRQAVVDAPEATEALQQALRVAGKVNAPAWIVEGLLREFESWRRPG